MLQASGYHIVWRQLETWDPRFQNNLRVVEHQTGDPGEAEAQSTLPAMVTVHDDFGSAFDKDGILPNASCDDLA